MARTRTYAAPLRSRTLRVLAAAATVATVMALAVLTPPTVGQAAEEDSSVTVRWAGGNDPELQQHQVDHETLLSDGNGGDGGSGHWDDFKDLEVSVSQTRGLIDQVVTVTASGMNPTVRDSGLTTNFLQIFQCWGDDPNGADFAKTCQWGGYSPSETGGTIDSSLSSLFGSLGDHIINRGGLRFRTVTGEENESQVVGQNGSTGLSEFFDALTSNEKPFVPVAADGTASINVTVQSAAAQPYLGCGDPDAAGERCWLVVVPRGAHSGSLETGEKCGPVGTSAHDVYGNEWSQNGPIFSPSCSYWNDRVVVPLDFQDPFVSCPPGSAERRVVGSELFTEAVSSWQPRLCAGEDAPVFTLTTSSGDLARAQLLTGQAGFAAVSQPLAPDTIGSADPTLLDTADLQYAPLANTALTIGFVSEGRDGTVNTDMKLTPRLIAKMLTQSFQNDVPKIHNTTEVTVGDSLEHLSDETILEDEEWLALGNASNMAPAATRGSWVVIGPQGDDAIRMLWQYVLADADAVAFLRGEPDPWGNTINRYYLPPGAPDAAGGGFDLLTSAIDTFPKADQSQAPDKAAADERYRGIQLDSTAYSPYSLTFEANASRVAAVNRRITFLWDPSKLVGNTIGAWVAGVPELPGSVSGRLAFGPTTASAAENYHLGTAQLALPLGATTTKDTVGSAREFVGYDDATVATAIAVQKVDQATGIALPDMAALPSGAYPLSTTLYAAVDLAATGLDADARAEYATLLDYAASDGNVHTGTRGGLPEGYVPLTDTQTAAARQLAELLRTPRSETPPASGENSGAPNTSSAASSGAPADGDGGATTATSTSSSASVEAELTAATASPAQGIIGGSLLAGIGGLLATPFLLRRRDAGG